MKIHLTGKAAEVSVGDSGGSTTQESERKIVLMTFQGHFFPAIFLNNSLYNRNEKNKNLVSDIILMSFLLKNYLCCWLCSPSGCNMDFFLSCLCRCYSSSQSSGFSLRGLH